MKKTLLVFGCLVSSSLCVASSAQQALPYDYYNLRDNVLMDYIQSTIENLFM